MATVRLAALCETQCCTPEKSEVLEKTGTGWGNPRQGHSSAASSKWVEAKWTHRWHWCAPETTPKSHISFLTIQKTRQQSHYCPWTPQGSYLFHLFCQQKIGIHVNNPIFGIKNRVWLELKYVAMPEIRCYWIRCSAKKNFSSFNDWENFGRVGGGVAPGKASKPPQILQIL